MDPMQLPASSIIYTSAVSPLRLPISSRKLTFAHGDGNYCVIVVVGYTIQEKQTTAQNIRAVPKAIMMQEYNRER